MITTQKSSSVPSWRTGWLAIMLAVAPGLPLAAQSFTVELELRGQRFEGTPLAWTDSDVALLARDGRLLRFAPVEARDYRRTASGFRGYSQAELRTALHREFGPAFDATGTGHFLVVHPAGGRDKWASRFEQLYRSFVHYFAARGWELAEPPFPLVAVVFPDQRSFHRHAAAAGDPVVSGLQGYYSPASNRILLFDATEGGSINDDSWQVNAQTIIHEAAHQAAFNTGVHSRWAMPPRWVAEGLGTLFESPGVWNARQFPRPADRVHLDLLARFRHDAATRRPHGSLASFVSDDRAFDQDAAAAYAESWALTFFLIETESARYLEYLRTTAARPAFTAYRGPERLRDFTAAFGPDLGMLEARFLRFIDGLPAR